MKKILLCALISVISFTSVSCGSNVSDVDLQDTVVSKSIDSEEKNVEKIIENNSDTVDNDKHDTIDEVYPEGEYKITYSATLSNFTDKVIDEIYVKRGNTSRKLAGSLEVGENIYVEWSYNEIYPINYEGYSEWDSPYFVIVSDGNEIPITKAKFIGDVFEVREELFMTDDWMEDETMRQELNITASEIIFFNEGEDYYLSTQLDYLDKEMYTETDEIKAEYIYLEQVRRWIRKREDQNLYAIGLTKQEIIEYFPEYNDNISEEANAILLSDDKVYLYDAYINLSESGDSGNEILKSNEVYEFNTTDSQILVVDHERSLDLYFRYEDENGNIHRQYISDQFRDNNNDGIINEILNIDDNPYNISFLK